MSVSQKMVSSRPKIMTSTKVSISYCFATKTNFIISRFVRKMIKYSNHFVDRQFFVFVPVEFFHMFRMVIQKFKIVDSIISFYSVFMMNLLCRQKWATKMFFHHKSMLQNSFSSIVYSGISMVSGLWQTFFKNSPVRGNTVVTMPLKSASVFLANLSLNRIENFITTIYFTYFAFSHKFIITQRKHYVN